MTYGQHLIAINNLQKTYNMLSSSICSAAIAAGHGEIKLSELRKMPEYLAAYTRIAVIENKLRSAERAAVEEHCGYFEDGRFVLYSERVARRLRRQTKQRSQR